jgi:hypothetical protein
MLAEHRGAESAINLGERNTAGAGRKVGVLACCLHANNKRNVTPLGARTARPKE